MSIHRIRAVLLQELYITTRSVEVYFDIFIYSFIALLLFGFLSLYLAGTSPSSAAEYLLMGMLLWEIVRVTQYSVSVNSMWNIWSRNLSNMFVAPLNAVEYLIAHTLSGIIKTLIVFSIDSTLMILVFHFNIYQLGVLNLILAFISLTTFSFSAGIAILGLIFRFGVRIQAFTWSIIPMLQPLVGAFFPVSVLPTPLQYFAYLFPCTYVFEAMRHSLTIHAVDWPTILFSFALNLIYLPLAIWIFKTLFYQSRNSGQFARNEG